nr:GAD-like domain-containing protein [Acetobacter thailandicus]
MIFVNADEEKVADIDPKFDVRKYIKDYGELSYKRDVPKSICENYKDKLPDDLILFWREHGIGTWLSGKFQFCIPSDYSEIVNILFSGDPEIIPEKTHIIGYSAFGHLVIWNEYFQTCEINLPYLTMRIPKSDFNKFGATKFHFNAIIAGSKFSEFFLY